MPEHTTDRAPATTSARAATVLTDADAYTASLIDLVTASPSSYHAAAALAARLEAAGFTAVDETVPWGEDLPERGYVLRDGAVAAWMLPQAPGPATAFRVVGSHTDSPALKLKPAAALAREGYQLVNAEVYGGPLLNSFLDRDLGLAGRLVTHDGAVHLVRTGPLARVAQLAPHLDRSVNEGLHLDRQAHLTPLWSLCGQAAGTEDAATRGEADAVEQHLCELAGIERAELASHDVLTYPTEAPGRIGRHGEMLASSRLDNLSSVQASLVALEALAAGAGLGEGATARWESATARWESATARDAVVLIANDHEEVGSETRSGAAGPFLEVVLRRLARRMGLEGEAFEAAMARSVCVSADAGHGVHPCYPDKHDPAVRPVLGGGPLLKVNASQRYASDAVGAALWERACRAAGVPHQDFVSSNAVPCGSTIGPITATRLGMTTVDVGQPLLSMHSQRELCAVVDGPWLAQALAAFWAGL
ncbi:MULTISPECIES: M18 family aminopeptidase [unclassified Actinomyces]|uniref:M18 family aminopeptidase n=1 Tax=unclassified Actinomyces TaxID=2609248 RepID=UPI002017CEDC|nr:MULTISPECIES: M18 family aminopeptidase [unclassified Actinomyces]MCL3776882.1 M18 family aminopeptidase [Actinomyces sp. AC-20-1]MCL3790791.1 M18 family aminopeptidase [Actinomyces sp. 187325]MCL3792249.1 M18 family aminopeptidase [Actinomyces sp. 186855]MCL3795294.1 M18 family aminopeptidase [Actinomyces sp. 217892]